MHIVTDTGAVGRRVVGAEDPDCRRAAGCGHRQPPPRSPDAAAARRALADALESWKAGRPHADPSAPDPSLTVADDDWLYAGCDNGKVYDLSSKIPRIAYEIADDIDIFWLDIKDGVLGVSDEAGNVDEGEVVAKLQDLARSVRRVLEGEEPGVAAGEEAPRIAVVTHVGDVRILDPQPSHAILDQGRKNLVDAFPAFAAMKVAGLPPSPVISAWQFAARNSVPLPRLPT